MHMLAVITTTRTYVVDKIDYVAALLLRKAEFKHDRSTVFTVSQQAGWRYSDYVWGFF